MISRSVLSLVLPLNLNMKKLKKPIRKRYNEYEKKYQWLPMLLDAYHINDKGVYKELKLEQARRKEKVACHEGCHTCCLKSDVPISEIEVSGISWFSVEIINDTILRNKLKIQLKNHHKNLQCPFLTDGVCSIYPVRPFACREYFVFSAPCKPNEDAIISRPKDVWNPSRNVAWKSASKILPYYGYNDELEKIRVFESGFIHKNSKSMHRLDLTLIANTMDKFDSQ